VLSKLRNSVSSRSGPRKAQATFFSPFDHDELVFPRGPEVKGNQSPVDVFADVAQVSFQKRF
jgi:hypothetical protein